MNVNEVIANYVSAMVSDVSVHPNDHVNMSQSTNDVNPSALKIACLDLGYILLEKLSGLITSFESKATEFEHVVKLGRTHIQDAVPTTLGEEFRAYASIISEDKKRITQALEYMNALNLGGTAIGNSVNATKEYIVFVYEELSRITGRSFEPAHSMMAQTSSQSDFCHLSAAINLLCLDLSKISTDIRFMASGPKGGIGEIFLEPLQNGSSIMPGKVNPVIPESINQVYFYVQGKNLTIHEAAHNAHLELAIMFPVLADSLISMLKMTTAAIEIFAEKCLRPMKANEERCKELLENSMAYATLLVPKYGYEKVSEIVRFAIREHRSLRDAAAEYGIVEDFGKL
jgi:aspartate ammonia-lyase